MIGYITRIIHFSSAHRLHSHGKSVEENKEIYGKCNNEHYHGHNYKTFVTLRGEIDHDTGMIMNLTQLKSLLQGVIEKLDHANLDLDVEFFKSNPRYFFKYLIFSTAENLTVYIWKELQKVMPDPNLLYEIKVEETVNNSASYKGE